MDRLKCTSKAQRVVVKVGTNVMAASSGRLDSHKMNNLVRQITALTEQGVKMVLVSSGAIAAGLEKLGIEERPTAIPELQATASVGQGILLHQYINLFGKHNVKVGQVLLTQYDITHRQQYVNASNTFEKLLDLGVVPIVNENDTTAVDEIKFGENDTLAALVANLVRADLLIILSDVDGLYTANPNRDETAELIPEVKEITPEIDRLAGGADTTFGSGGMITKLQAARIVTLAGAGMIVASGEKKDVLLDIMSGEPVGTFFHPRKKKMGSRKAWIAFGRMTKGSVVVDDGAKEAILKKGKSLLPAGIVSCKGDFSIGDAIDIKDLSGHVIAKGLSSFTCEELISVKGMKSEDISKKSDGTSSEEAVHRDCLVVLK